MPLMRHVLINMLRQLDYKDIVEATDGLQALAIIKNQLIDLVITDLHMSKMDGLAYLMQLEVILSMPNSLCLW